MIRINLLPRTRAAAGTAALPTQHGQMGWWLIYGSGALLSLLAVVWMVVRTSSLEGEQQQKNAALAAEVERLKAQGAKLDELQKELARAEQLAKVVADLDRARTGPARALVELSRILSVGGGPTLDLPRLARLNGGRPLAGFQTNWDPRRLWLTAFVENDRKCTLEGIGRTNEDVAEFIRRLSISQLFDDIRLHRSEIATAKQAALPWVGFELNGKVKY